MLLKKHYGFMLLGLHKFPFTINEKETMPEMNYTRIVEAVIIAIITAIITTVVGYFSVVQDLKLDVTLLDSRMKLNEERQRAINQEQIKFFERSVKQINSNVREIKEEIRELRSDLYRPIK